jgi:hypothetical protein
MQPDYEQVIRNALQEFEGRPLVPEEVAEAIRPTLKVILVGWEGSIEILDVTTPEDEALGRSS